MEEHVIIQGREVSCDDIELIRNLMLGNPDWGRTRLSEEICYRWNWHNDLGRIKDMSARAMLLKLERSNIIQLPPRRRPSNNKLRNRNNKLVPHETVPIISLLKELQPLVIQIVEPRSMELKLFNCLLNTYHYLGHQNTAGKNMRYLIRDHTGRPVACSLFGSPAWKCAPRDNWIGWNAETQKTHLQGLANNTRFLILPWVEVPNLASHVLGSLSRRIRVDWQKKYGHPIQALETFVDFSRFRGTCYQAANWVQVGKTQGRTRNDMRHRIKTTVKDIYMYPLIANFRQELNSC